MDYITIIVDAIVAFFKNFSFNDILAAYGKIDVNGIRDAFIAIVSAIQKVVG